MPSEIAASTRAVDPSTNMAAAPVAVPAEGGLAGALPLAVLALAFCALFVATGLVSGHWVPEVMVFGLAAALVGIVSRAR